MVAGPVVLAAIIGLLIWLATASVLWAVIAFILVLLIGGGGLYSRRL